MKEIKLLWKFMKGSRMLYIGAILCIGLATLFSFLSPLVIRFTIDSVIGQKQMELPQSILSIVNTLGGREYLLDNLWICALAIVVLALFNGFFTYFKGKWSAAASELTSRNIRDELYCHLQNVSYD